MQIKSAEYIISSALVSQCPKSDLPEYAFIGRSNVGKSSLINMLTGYSKLAKTSATPGKTTLINHFLINNEWYLVDLPGYGYAKRSQKEQDKFERMIDGYILQREQMYNLFLLIDIRHPAQAVDLEFMTWLGENGVPFSIVFTKADKLAKTKVQAQARAYMDQLREQWEELPPYFVTSAEARLGREEVLDYIASINRGI
ncbi:MAG TPA: YihA family ribosome biogenesis GTP-binding protein [Prevotellaceae bacterium]|nr:YihA family ribosome biogenesis GTP-binding protein [Prevotellaceae bacterium]